MEIQRKLRICRLLYQASLLKSKNVPLINDNTELYKKKCKQYEIAWNLLKSRHVLLFCFDYKKEHMYPSFFNDQQVGDTYYAYKLGAIIGGFVLHTNPSQKILYVSDKLQGGELGTNYTINYLIE